MPRSRVPAPRVTKGKHMIQRFTRSETTIRRGLLLLALVPPLVTLAYILRYGIDVPYMDQWNSVLPQVLHTFDGKLTWDLLFRQHNEFRPLAPRLLWLPLAAITHWSIPAELILNYIVALGSFALLMWHGRGTRDRRSPSDAAVLLTVSILHFSILQWENWINGFQLVVFLNVFAALLGLSMLVRTASPLAFIAALLLGGVTAFSTTNGLLYWPVGALLLVLRIATRSGYRPVHLLIWLASFATLVGSYFHDYVRPPTHPSMLAFLEQPSDFVRYLLVILGRGVGADPLRATLSATVLLSTWVLLARTLPIDSWKRFALDPDRQFFLGAGLFALLSMLAIAVGRTGFGWQQASSPRYATISSLLWISTILLAGSWFRARQGAHDELDRATTAWPHRALLGLMLFVSIANLHGSSRWWSRSIQWHYVPVCQAQQALLDGQASDELLEILHPKPETVRAGARELAGRELSLFHDPARADCEP